MIEVYMARLGLESGAAGWKAQTIPLSHGGTQCTIHSQCKFDTTIKVANKSTFILN